MAKERWQLVGGPMGGTTMALAFSPNFARDGLCWAATRVGLFRSSDRGHTWARVGGPGFQPMTAVAVSPGYDQDHTLLAGTQSGPYVSRDGGETWLAGRFQVGPTAAVSALALSPAFPRDGIAFAGTVQDGIFRSNDRGESWHGWNFGLLDLNVLTVAVSPAFEEDETIFAATTTALFRSKNGGRAWREVAFPRGASPVLALALSPAFASDGTIFAGTESAGAFRSTDRGATWQALTGLPAEESVNGLAVSPAFAQDRTVLALTGEGLYVSRDAGETWTLCAALPGALCLATSPSATLVGLAQEGVWIAEDGLARWQPANTGLAARAFAGFALSPALAQDGTLFVYGPGEGLFCSEDGGRTWFEAMDGLPSLDVVALALSPDFARDGTAYAALAEGICRSRDRGRHWEMVSDLPAQALALSPAFASDGTLLVGTRGQGVHLSPDRGERWEPLPVPPEAHTIGALALSPTFPTSGHLFIAAAPAEEGGLKVWDGDRRGASWRRMVARGCGGGWVSLAVSPAYAKDGQWFAAAGNAVYRPPLLAGRGHGQEIELAAQPLSPERPAALYVAAALDGRERLHLFAASPVGVFTSRDVGRRWQHLAGDPSPGPALAVIPSPGYAHDRQVYALALGGLIWRGEAEAD